MVWLAISTRGISNPQFFKSGFNINTNTYLQCLKRGLIPFIKKYHPLGERLFWPDKASSHYAKPVLDFLKAENIPVVSKDNNPTNVPQARPIERFWANLQRMVYSKGRTFDSSPALIARIKYCIHKTDVDVFNTYMKGVPDKLRQISDKGVYSID